MSEERARILQMISEGKITADEGAKLLNALRGASGAQQSTRAGTAGWFRVRVTDMVTGRTRVNVNIPFSLVKAGIKLGARFSPEIEDLDWNELLAAIEDGAVGKLVEVEDNEGRERVEVFIE